MGYHDDKGVWIETDLTPQIPSVMFARGVVTANVADRTLFTVASNDGLTYAEGERVLLAGQTTGAESGLYVVGRVSAVITGKAALTRTQDWCGGKKLRNGATVEVAEGRIFSGSTWTTMATGACVIGTDAPLFKHTARRPRTQYARGVVFADVADLAAFTVASNDGLTYVAGEIVLLANQTTAAQCGLYVVGTVTATTAPLTRHPDFAAGQVVPNGMTVEVAEGTIWVGSTWKATATGTCVIATTDPAFYPKQCKGILTLASGTYTLGATEGLFLRSATLSNLQASMNTPGGTLTLTTGGYGFNSAGLTPGKSGTGAAICIARVVAGTIDTANNSTVNWLCTNW